MDALRKKLNQLKQILTECGESDLIHRVLPPIDSSDMEIQTFLISNELWGGAGSIADQAGIEGGREQRRSIEKALIELGKAQIQAGLTNTRTQLWVEAFSQRQDQDI